MYPQPGPREPGKGGNPTSGKIQKITPEWQTEQFRSVDSAVARVKGKHHDGDVLSWTVNLCRQIRWYREPVRPVWMKGFFFFYSKKAERPHHHIYERKRHTKDKTKQATKEIPILEKYHYFKEEFKCTTKSPIT